MNKDLLLKKLKKIHDVLVIKKENKFKVQAYETAIRTLEGTVNLENIIRERKVEEIPHLGKRLSAMVYEFFDNGDISFLKELEKEVTAGILSMLEITGMGPSKISVIYNLTDIRDIDSLKKACEENRLSDLPGFGIKTQTNILKNIKYMLGFKDRKLYSEVEKTAYKIVDYLKEEMKIIRIDVAGSLRRKMETVKDIDILLCITQSIDLLIEKIEKAEFCRDMTEKGSTKISFVTTDNIQCDIRVIEEEQYAHALSHFTGSASHNVQLRKKAKELGYSMSEYGFKNESGKLIFKTEEEIYEFLGFKFVPPEQREGEDELEVFKDTEVELVELSDIKGFFHCHTNSSDGDLSLEEVVSIAQSKGYKYIGISDHSKSSWYAGGLKEHELIIQKAEIKELQKKYNIKIFHGVECDILEDGSLDYSDDILGDLDFVIISVHSRFDMGEEKMTERVLKALENPNVTMLAHPSGRLLTRRPPYKIDLEKIIQKAGELGRIIEINGNPWRLDLDWRFHKYAVDSGVTLSINPDLHEFVDFENIRYGVNIARKGRLSKKNIFNSKSLKEISEILSKK